MKNKYNKRITDNKYLKMLQDKKDLLKSKRTIAIIVLMILLVVSCVTGAKNKRYESTNLQNNNEQSTKLTTSVEEKENEMQEKDKQIKRLQEENEKLKIEKATLEKQKNSLENENQNLNSQTSSTAKNEKQQNVNNTTTIQNKEVTTPVSETVYITDTGKKYHRDGCQYLKKSKKTISLQNAQKQGYTPCSKCY